MNNRERQRRRAFNKWVFPAWLRKNFTQKVYEELAKRIEHAVLYGTEDKHDNDNPI